MTDSLATAKVYDLKPVDGIVHNDTRLPHATGHADKSRTAEIHRIF